MTGVLVRLKLRILANWFRRSPWQVVGLALALLYGAALTVIAVGALVGLRFAPVDLARPIVVLAGSLAVVGFALAPLLFGVDDTLDPRRFSLFGVERTRLAGGLIVAALVGVPGAVLVVVALATVVTWSRSPRAALVAVVAAPLIVLLCTLLARIAAAAAGLLLATRRSRESIAAVAVIGLVALGPLLLLLSDLDVGRAGLRRLAGAVDVLSWTPFGAPWAAPASVAAGSTRAGVAQLLIAAASVLLLGLAWRALVGRVLSTPARTARPQTVAGLGWFSLLPATPLGAVAARSFTYWARDVRYRVSVLIVPLTPVALVLVLGFVDVPGSILALVPVPVVALFAGWSSHDDIAYDSTAIWLHVAAGTRGVDDRLGRLAPVIAIAVPLLVVGSIVSAEISGDVGIAPALIGVSICLLLAGMGLGGITSALLPYPVPQPGASPFQQPNTAGGVSAAVQSVLFLLQLVAAAPAIALLVLGLRGQPDAYWGALGAGLVAGAVVFAGGTALGARAFERRGPELIGAALRA